MSSVRASAAVPWNSPRRRRYCASSSSSSTGSYSPVLVTGVLVHQLDAELVPGRAAGQSVQVLVPQPVVPAQGSEAVLVLVPATVEVYAAVDRDVLHHCPAALLHGAVDGDGRVSRADEIQAVRRLTTGALPQIITVPGKL